LPRLGYYLLHPYTYMTIRSIWLYVCYIVLMGQFWITESPGTILQYCTYFERVFALLGLWCLMPTATQTMMMQNDHRIVTAVKPLFLHRRKHSKHALHLFVIIISYIGSVRVSIITFITWCHTVIRWRTSDLVTVTSVILRILQFQELAV